MEIFHFIMEGLGVIFIVFFFVLLVLSCLSEILLDEDDDYIYRNL